MPASKLDLAWWHQMHNVMHGGREVSPRGQLTRELASKKLIFDMNYPVITHPNRKLGYKFMAAEAWWILSGRDDVESIAPYSKNISNFSDDGHKFFGAYGPPVVDQLPYVVESLKRDPDSRQALLTMWRQKPPVTKDVPCTVAMDFMIRGGRIEAHVFMRSSDNWLGIPYDAFNFTMVACEVASQLNHDRRVRGETMLFMGNMHLTAASSHLYERDFEAVRSVLHIQPPNPTRSLPSELFDGTSPLSVADFLQTLKDTKEGHPLRWWEE